MKDEPREVVSGLKAVGVIALLASLLLLPAASAVSYAMTAEVMITKTTGSVGDSVVYYYTLRNIGDQPLYNVTVDGMGDEEPSLIGELPVGAEESVVGSYIIKATDIETYEGSSYVFNKAMATAENSGGSQVATSYVEVGILIV